MSIYPLHMFSWRNKKNINLIPPPNHPSYTEIWSANLKLSFSGIICRKTLEWPHLGHSTEYPQHMFCNKMTKTITKIIFLYMAVNYSSVEAIIAQTANKISLNLALRSG